VTKSHGKTVFCPRGRRFSVKQEVVDPVFTVCTARNGKPFLCWGIKSQLATSIGLAVGFVTASEVLKGELLWVFFWDRVWWRSPHWHRPEDLGVFRFCPPNGRLTPTVPKRDPFWNGFCFYEPKNSQQWKSDCTNPTIKAVSVNMLAPHFVTFKSKDTIKVMRQINPVYV
jgi:hypothetical protein